MRKSYATAYEDLLSKVFQRGRSFSDGTSADYYRKLDHSYERLDYALNPDKYGYFKTVSKSIAQLQQEHSVLVADIASRVDGAITEAKSRFSHILSSEQLRTLTELQAHLKHPTFEQLEEAIGTADSLLGRAGIYPR